MLGSVGIGACHQLADAGLVGVGVPDLLPVDDPLVAVPDRPRLQPGDVGPGLGLAEQLRAQEVTSIDRREEPSLEFVTAVGEHGRTDHVPRHREHALVGHLEVGLQLAPQVVQLRIVSAPAVLGRTTGPRQAGVERLGPPARRGGEHLFLAPGLGGAHHAHVIIAFTPHEALGARHAAGRVGFEERRRPADEVRPHAVIHPHLRDLATTHLQDAERRPGTSGRLRRARFGVDGGGADQVVDGGAGPRDAGQSCAPARVARRDQHSASRRSLYALMIMSTNSSVEYPNRAASSWKGAMSNDLRMSCRLCSGCARRPRADTHLTRRQPADQVVDECCALAKVGSGDVIGGSDVAGARGATVFSGVTRPVVA